jgi:glycosyl transferase family 87
VRRSLDSRGSPFLYASMAWVSDRYDTALVQYRIAILAAFIAGVVILGIHCGVPLYVTLFLLAGLIRFFLPFRADFIVGNVNAMQLFLLAVIVVIIEKWPRTAGAILAMMVAAKPTLVLVAFVLFGSRLLTREYRRFFHEVTGAAIGSLAAIAIGSYWFGTPRAWLQWFASAGGLWEMLLGREFNNVAPALRLFQQYGTWVSYAIALTLLVIAAIPILRTRKRDDLLLVSLGPLIYFLSSKLVWLHYLVLTIPAAFALLRHRWTSVIAIGTLLLMADEPRRLLIAPTSPDTREPLITISLIALYATCTLLECGGPSRRFPTQERET